MEKSDQDLLKQGKQLRKPPLSLFFRGYFCASALSCWIFSFRLLPVFNFIAFSCLGFSLWRIFICGTGLVFIGYFYLIYFLYKNSRLSFHCFKRQCYVFSVLGSWANSFLLLPSRFLTLPSSSFLSTNRYPKKPTNILTSSLYSAGSVKLEMSVPQQRTDLTQSSTANLRKSLLVSNISMRLILQAHFPRYWKIIFLRISLRQYVQNSFGMPFNLHKFISISFCFSTPNWLWLFSPSRFFQVTGSRSQLPKRLSCTIISQRKAVKMATSLLTFGFSYRLATNDLISEGSSMGAKMYSRDWWLFLKSFKLQGLVIQSASSQANPMDFISSLRHVGIEKLTQFLSINYIQYEHSNIIKARSYPAFLLLCDTREYKALSWAVAHQEDISVAVRAKGETYPNPYEL